MLTQQTTYEFRPVGDGDKTAKTDLFYKEEIQLALRNRGMPLEGLRYDVTPTGMHYLLIHFDIPAADEESWSLDIGGLVQNPVTLDMSDVRSRPQVTMPVTMECAGNGRALMEPRAISQPWLLEAIGTAEWTGTPLRPILEEAGIASDAVELLFTGTDQGVQGGELQYYQRSLTIDQAMRDEVMLAYGMNGAPLQPQHGYPLRLIVPGWYGMTSVKWLTRIEAISEPFDGYQQMRTYRYAQTADDVGDPVDLIRVRSLMAPPGVPDFLTRTRLVEAGTHRIAGQGVGRQAGRDEGRVQRRRGPNVDRRRSRPARWRLRLAIMVSNSGRRSPESTPYASAPPTKRATYSRPSSPGTTRAWATTCCTEWTCWWSRGES